MDTFDLVRIAGTLICLTGIVLCWRFARTRVGAVAAPRLKAVALAGFVAAPLGALAVANYHTFEGTHAVDGCARCHVMWPMVNDLKDPASDSLAARHYRQAWISTNECYGCHADYGWRGSLKAKMDGFRHLSRYTTGTYQEPIVFRGHFNNGNCLKCHAGTPPFEQVSSHRLAARVLSESAMSCLNCHGDAHPTRAQRTPGSSAYAHLMEKPR